MRTAGCGSAVSCRRPMRLKALASKSAHPPVVMTTAANAPPLRVHFNMLAFKEPLAALVLRFISPSSKRQLISPGAERPRIRTAAEPRIGTDYAVYEDCSDRG